MTDTPLARLRTLAGQGSLVEHYGSVAGILADMVSDGDAADLIRAGTLLKRLDSDLIKKHHPGTRTVSLAVTGWSTLDGLIAPLTAELARHDWILDPHVSDFGSYRKDLNDTNGQLYTGNFEAVLCVLDAQAVLDRLPGPWTASDVEKAVSDFGTELEELTERFLTEGSGRLVLNTITLPRSLTHQVVDHATRCQIGIHWRELNIRLLRLAARSDRVAVIDMEPLVAASGPLSDARMAQYAKMRVSDELLAAYAREVAHLIRAFRGRSKKVLVVDLDNTLWDGILGDDGPDGIAAASTLRGEAFGAFQRVIRQLASQGVLLAVCSKNDEGPVRQVLSSHADMTLRLQDFVRITANWRPKEANLRLLAQELDLGLDSFVFVDDSPAECGLVASTLPQVAVVRLDDEPALHIERLLMDDWFATLRLTAEDRTRSESYRALTARQSLREAAGSAESYLRDLGVTVSVSTAKGFEAERLSQLTLRTNQFNLTGERLSAAEVTARCADPECLVLSVRSADRFGDNGLIGAVFARRRGSTMHIDNMLLSCRVFDRGVETAAMVSLLAYARAHGHTAVTGTYRATERNRRFADFYPSLGFTRGDSTETEAEFRHSLEEVPGVPDHLQLGTHLEELS
ncbi:HAD-IIIC family phosphatase [Streptomyces flaveolus]|uniref:HAD-IIIC family phosphatase n=1 Tax=Streptomyces flaveolus TaxID=67297 RepID=UPI0034049671